jgi:hypothetical protein
MSTVTTEARPDLILGIAQGYSLEQLKPFVASLKQSGYQGETVLFCHHLDSGAVESLGQWGVQVVPFHNVRSPKSSRIARSFFYRLARLYYRHKWPFYDQAWPWLLAVAKQRYQLYRQFLKNSPNRYRRVLLTDVIDVFFQREPFQGCPESDLVFFEEDSRQLLRSGTFNRGVILSLLGEPTFLRLQNRPTICSGTTIGTPAAIIHYLEKFLALMKTAHRLEMPLGDQAIHNAVVYEHLAGMPFSISIAPNHRGPVYTVGEIPEKEIQVSPHNEILFPDGRIAPVVHQYDRFPRLDALLQEKARTLAPS